MINLQKQQSLTSKNTCKESLNLSVSKIHSVGFDHDAELPQKKWSMKPSHYQYI